MIPLVGGSSSGTIAGRSSLIGGVPRGRIRLGGVRGMSKDIVEWYESACRDHDAFDFRFEGLFVLSQTMNYLVIIPSRVVTIFTCI